MPQKKKKIPNTYTRHNRVTLARGGKDYFDRLLKMIHGAKETLHLQTYIFDDAGETGQMVAKALKEAAKRNVAVYMVIDGYASKSMSDDFVEDLEKAGIHFRFFEPLFRSKTFYFGRRMHHKIVVADANCALIGGINIADRYNDLPGSPAWLDFAVLVEGDTAKNLCELCRKIWHGYTRQKIKISCGEGRAPISIAKEDLSQVRIRRNDWVNRKNEISITYSEILKTAKSEVTILCSYFLPGKSMRRQMVRATKRGVTIRVIAAGVSDVVVAKNAERWLYDWLLRNKIELYEYKKNVLHGKTATCDDQWMTIGSYNVNNLSSHASIELNLDIQDPAFTRHMNQKLQQIIDNDCDRITEEHDIKTRNPFRQLMRWCAYHLLRVALFLFTFYFKQKG